MTDQHVASNLATDISRCPAIEVDGVAYTYPDGTEALRGVTFALAPGEAVGLIGPNGAGKSTLIWTLAGFLAPSRGRAIVQGREVRKANLADVRRRLGLMFQNPDDQLFMPTLEDDLAFGPVNLGLSESGVRERVASAAAQMDLCSMLDRPPHHLSMGQRRGAAIAAVLAMQPSLLLMDEPSSNLDPRSRRRLIEVLAGLDATMLIAAHDLDMVGRLCERVAVIDAGRIVADGAAREILGSAALMEQYGLETWREPRE